MDTKIFTPAVLRDAWLLGSLSQRGISIKVWCALYSAQCILRIVEVSQDGGVIQLFASATAGKICFKKINTKAK